MCLEFEDLFVVLGVAALTNVAGHFVSGEIGGIPMSIVVQYGVPLSIVPLLMLFKYGRPRGYVRDLPSGTSSRGRIAPWPETAK